MIFDILGIIFFKQFIQLFCIQFIDLIDILTARIFFAPYRFDSRQLM